MRSPHLETFAPSVRRKTCTHLSLLVQMNLFQINLTYTGWHYSKTDANCVNEAHRVEVQSCLVANKINSLQNTLQTKAPQHMRSSQTNRNRFIQSHTHTHSGRQRQSALIWSSVVHHAAVLSQCPHLTVGQDQTLLTTYFCSSLFLLLHIQLDKLNQDQISWWNNHPRFHWTSQVCLL